ncbi:MAG: murein L,D-transpeptidase, partial [Hyphomonas sp.]
VSAGCIRVQEAVELSEWVLEDIPAWDRTRIDAAINSRRATRAALSSPMSIHIVYLTAFPAADGTMTYAADIYGKDAEVLPALAGYTLSAGAHPVSGGSAK